MQSPVGLRQSAHVVTDWSAAGTAESPLCRAARAQGRLHHINLGANAPKIGRRRFVWEIRGKGMLSIIILHF